MMENFKYRFEIVSVYYETMDDDSELRPDIVLDSVYYNGINILPIMNEADCIELKEEMYNKLF
jgi:hypothetical protein